MNNPSTQQSNEQMQNNIHIQNNIADDEIDLRELLSVIWQGKWIIIAITTLFTVASVFYAINQPNIYKSEVLLAPAEQDQQGAFGSLTGQLGGLASLAGVNLGSNGGGDKTQMALEVLKSRQFTSEFIQKHNILPDLMAAKSWNRKTNTVIYDDELYIAEQNKWVREIEAPFNPEPSMQEAYKEFKKVISTSKDQETGMVTISVQHLSPYLAKQWVNWLVQDINKTMKQRDVLEANKSTDFLMSQLEKTKIADIRTVLYKLVEEQAKTIMFANVRNEYVFKTIDPAIVPELWFKPKRVLTCILGFILGVVLSMILVLIRHCIKRQFTSIG